MALTEYERNKLVKEQKQIASDQFALIQDKLEMIKKNFNSELLTHLKKGKLQYIPDEEDEQEENKNNTKKF